MAQFGGNRSSIMGLCNPLGNTPVRSLSVDTVKFDRTPLSFDPGSNSSLGNVMVAPDQVDPQNAKMANIEDIKLDMQNSGSNISGISASSFDMLDSKSIDEEKESVKLSFCSVYCNAVKYYHRLISVFIGCPA